MSNSKIPQMADALVIRMHYTRFNSTLKHQDAKSVRIHILI